MLPYVSAILLAAGSSKRMGQMKQLLPLGSKPVIRHCLDALITSGIHDIILVIGPRGYEIMNVVVGLDHRQFPSAEKGESVGFRIELVFNKEPESDMAASVRIGLDATDPLSSGVLIYPSDHPLVSSETVRALVRLHQEIPQKILIPVHQGRRGHPALFPKHCLDEISEGGTLRDVIDRDSARVRFVEVPDEGVILDMDTMDDYMKLAERVAARPL